MFCDGVFGSGWKNWHSSKSVRHSGANKFWLILFFFITWLQYPQCWDKVHQRAFSQVWGQRHCALVPQVLGQPGVKLLWFNFALESLEWHRVASLREQFAATAGRQTLFEVCSVCSGFPSLMLFAWFASCAWKNGSTQHATSTNSLLKVLFCRNIVFLYSIQPLGLG